MIEQMETMQSWLADEETSTAAAAMLIKDARPESNEGREETPGWGALL